jgi:two-component system phosphate regulon response regulator PhoB
VDWCVDATAAQAKVLETKPDLILLDWMLPGMSGIEWLMRLRMKDDFKKLPVIMLTARGEETDKVSGLEVGADDYVTKPFSISELMARIHALLRRTETKHSKIIKVGGLVLDLESHRVTANGVEISMSPTEYKLLQFFIMNIERVFSRAQLLDQVWGTNVYIEERTVDVHIRRLRKILDQHGFQDVIQTVRSFGYRMSMKTNG